jgi:hypothetical protein
MMAMDQPNFFEKVAAHRVDDIVPNDLSENERRMLMLTSYGSIF